MAAPRRVIEIEIRADDLERLQATARSRIAPACRVERARLLGYHVEPSTCAVGEALGVTHQTVPRCLRRAEEFGVMAALDDSPRPSKATEITAEARAWLVSLACQDPRTWPIRMSCGQRDCLGAMPASTSLLRGIPA
jgi:hypothetical protein